MMIISLWLVFFHFFVLVINNPPQHNTSGESPDKILFQTSFINERGTTVSERFPEPQGYIRKSADTSSFAGFLRRLPLKPHGSKVRIFDGTEKEPKGIYCAVLDWEIGSKDLQQCADAIIRLRAEYLYEKKRFNEIQFSFTNGQIAKFTEYAEGYRAEIRNNRVVWTKKTEKDYSQKSLKNYLEMVFMYSGTQSLNRDLNKVTNPQQIQIGNVFIHGGFPGHAVIVLDMVVNEKTGGNKFLIAQSYMPAQDIQILINPEDNSPWFKISSHQKLITPEWIFDYNELKRFPGE